jgi:hypothetical protein
MHTTTGTTETTETNWAPALTNAVESAGFTIAGLPDHLNREQVLELGEGIVPGVLERTAATGAGLAVVAAAAEGLGFTLVEVAERCGLSKRDINALAAADVGRMSRTAGTCSESARS